jgi:hypothetical protein
MSSTPTPTRDVIDLTLEPDSPPLPPPISENAGTATTDQIRHGIPPDREVIDLEDEQRFFDTIDLMDDDGGMEGYEVDGELDVEVLYSVDLPEARVPNLWPDGLPHPHHTQTQPENPPTRPIRALSGWNLPRLRDLPHLLDYLHRSPGGITPRQETVLRAEQGERAPPFRPQRQYPFVEQSRGAHAGVVIPGHVMRESFRLPVDLDFEAQAFHLGVDDDVARVIPDPVYNAPTPARSGYTRSLKEDDVAVCPNCDDELGTGDSDLKRQVWFIKKCGHVSLQREPGHPADGPIGLLWRLRKAPDPKHESERLKVTTSEAIRQLCSRRLWEGQDRIQNSHDPAVHMSDGGQQSLH